MTGSGRGALGLLGPVAWLACAFLWSDRRTDAAGWTPGPAPQSASRWRLGGAPAAAFSPSFSPAACRPIRQAPPTARAEGRPPSTEVTFMRRNSVLIAAFALFLGGCATTQLLQHPGESSLVGGLYSNQTYALTLHFRNLQGWQFFTESSSIGQLELPLAIFAAQNHSRLLHLVLMLEDGGIPMSNEDYQTVVKANLDPDVREAIEQLTLQPGHINGNEAVIWIYRFDGHVHSDAFFSRGSQNFWLKILTSEDSYERRQEEILGIIRSFDFLEAHRASLDPGSPAHRS